MRYYFSNSQVAPQLFTLVELVLEEVVQEVVVLAAEVLAVELAVELAAEPGVQEEQVVVEDQAAVVAEEVGEVVDLAVVMEEVEMEVRNKTSLKQFL